MCSSQRHRLMLSHRHAIACNRPNVAKPSVACILEQSNDGDGVIVIRHLFMHRAQSAYGRLHQVSIGCTGSSRVGPSSALTVTVGKGPMTKLFMHRAETYP
jgi:hypothetical protein